MTGGVSRKLEAKKKSHIGSLPHIPFVDDLG